MALFLGKKHDKGSKNDKPSGEKSKKPLFVLPDAKADISTEEFHKSFEALDISKKASKINSMTLKEMSNYCKASGQNKYSKLSPPSDENDVAVEDLKTTGKASKSKGKMLNKVFGIFKPSDEEETQPLLTESSDDDDDGGDDNGIIALDDGKTLKDSQEKARPTPKRKETTKHLFRLSIDVCFSFKDNDRKLFGKNSFYQNIPIDLISKNKKIPHIIHVSKFANPWKKVEDLTIVKGMNSEDLSRMVCYHRDDEEDIWYLSTTFPANEYLRNKIVEHPKIWAVTSVFKDGVRTNASQLLSESVPNSFSLNPRLERTYEAVYHVTTFDTRLVKHLDLMRVQGKTTTYGTEYHDYFTIPSNRVDHFIDRSNGKPIGEFFFRFH